MSETGRILIVDDEETFRETTAELLRGEGYLCDCAAESATATGLLSAREYDLLIADICMPGNANLEFVASAPVASGELSTVLVTGYPSLDTAIDSIRLEVGAYLLKPVDELELFAAARRGVARTRTRRAIRRTRERVRSQVEDLERLEALAGAPRDPSNELSVQSCLDALTATIATSLHDMYALTAATLNGDERTVRCSLAAMNQPTVLVNALRETIAVLEKTKSAFKSKDLGELRRRLEAILREQEQERPGAR